jgi:hypothetical protein
VSKGEAGAAIGVADGAFVRLLLLHSERKEPEVFYGPSHLNSPTVTGAGLAILEVSDFTLTGSEPVLSVFRRIGAHVYLDETD